MIRMIVAIATFFATLIRQTAAAAGLIFVAIAIAVTITVLFYEMIAHRVTSPAVRGDDR